jgi:hypothetical protein
MTFQRYSQRLLNPFRGTVNCISYESADAVTADGVRWDIYVSHAGLLQGLPYNKQTQVSDIRYGTWTAAAGLQRGPLYPSDDFRTLEEIGAVVYEHLLEVHQDIPFPFRDVFELWLLDAEGRPLALIDSATTLTDIDTHQPPRWTPGLESRKTFTSTTAEALATALTPAYTLADYLANYINGRAGKEPAAQIFERSAAGSGTGLGGSNLDNRYENRVLEQSSFPETLLDRTHHDSLHRQLISDFTCWQAPWLLLLPTLDTTMRRDFEQHARVQPGKLVQHFHCYPQIIDQAAIDAARVEVRLRESMADMPREREPLSTFYIELSPEVCK